MNSITISTKQVLILNKSQQFPRPTHNDMPLLAICKDATKKYWLYVYHKRQWRLVSDTPFTTQRSASEAAGAFDFTKLYNLYN
ncbi:hypothetical protein [Serratia sp. MF2]|uniref:hypothetical protein n=1 Tax=Serratia sp. MF2 TaxID=3059173 RepID=UPI0027F36DC2|nr:hypothetical protein [Serratia sp. MF2]MDQ7098145.1 hypothetical protein [Serratia sp. MF2]